MATIRVNRQAAHAGQLPQVCICCGTPAQQFVRHEFRFEPTWLILLLTAFPKMWIFFSYDTFQLNLPVCSSHTTRFKWPSYVGLATAGLLFLMFVPIIAMYATGNQDKMIVMIPVCLLIVAGYVISRFVLLFGGPRVVQYSAGTLEIAGVSEGFAQHVSGRGSFQQAQLYPPQQVYTGNYGVDQAAYQNAYHAPGGSSTRTLLIVAAAVGIPLLLIGMVVVAAVGVHSMRRSRLANFSANSPRPQASDFKIGDTVYLQSGFEWYRATVVEQRNSVLTVTYVDNFGRESRSTYFPEMLYRELPRGAELAKIRQLPSASPTSRNLASSPVLPRSTSPPPESIAAKPSTASPTGPTPEPSLPASPPASTQIPSAASTGEFLPDDTAYFELFGKWYQAKILRNIKGVCELTYFDPDIKREVKTIRPASQLKRNPPPGANVIASSGSRRSRTRSASSAPSTTT